jgi:2-dehydropantoate 2-reductase
MRIVVIGAGAMGGLFGAKLWASGRDVLLYDIWREHVDEIHEHGLLVEELDGVAARVRVPVSHEQPSSISEADLVLVEVKSYDTFAALCPFRERIRPEAYVLSLQNGVGNLEEMRRALPKHERIIVGTTAQGSNVVGPGHVLRTGAGPSEIGDPCVAGHEPDRLAEIADAFTTAGIEMTVAGDVLAAIWAKLAANSAINPLTALTGLRNGELPGDPDLEAIYRGIVAELTAVMDGLGIQRIKADYVAYAEFVMEATASSYSSMLQDVRNRRRTEVDAINGAIVRYGQELGVPAPVNAMVAALVRNRQRDYLEEGRGAFG